LEALCPSYGDNDLFFNAEDNNKIGYINYVLAFPAGISFNNLIHYSQIYWFNKFQEYDFDSKEKNIEYYGQELPPEIDVKKLSKVPITIFAAREDRFAGIKDAKWLFKELKTNTHIWASFEVINGDHASFLIGEDMSYMDRVIDIMAMWNPSYA